MYPFRYGEKQSRQGRQRETVTPCCAESTRVGKLRDEHSDDEGMGNHNLYMLNNGLHLDLDAKHDVEVDLETTNNVAARSRKAKDASALQRYYDEVKAHVRNSKKGKSVCRFMRKKCLHEEDIDNILTLDVKHMEANKYQKDVIIHSRLNHQAVSITLSKKLRTKYVNPFLAKLEAKFKLFNINTTIGDSNSPRSPARRRSGGPGRDDDNEAAARGRRGSASGPRKRVHFDLGEDAEAESPGRPPAELWQPLAAPAEKRYNANSFEMNIRMKEYNSFNNTESDEELKEVRAKMQASKGRKCTSFKLICKLQSLGDLSHLKDLEQELLYNKVDSILECKSVQHPCHAYPIYMLFEVIHVQRKTVQDQIDEQRQLREGLNKLVYFGCRVL